MADFSSFLDTNKLNSNGNNIETTVREVIAMKRLEFNKGRKSRQEAENQVKSGNHECWVAEDKVAGKKKKFRKRKRMTTKF